METKNAIFCSLREWGAQPSNNEQHAKFSRKITSQAIANLRTQYIPVDLNDIPKIPKDRDEAIKMLFVLDLQEYQDDEGFKLRSIFEEDALENILTKADNHQSIIFIAPYFQVQNSNCGLKFLKKRAFLRFRESDLEPFQRFSESREGLSKAQLAYKNGSDEGWMNGYAFEAIVASHAVHFESCFQCKLRNTIHWCGGTTSSWRDLYCRSCQSCFEIKSKKDKETIDRICQNGKLQGGSFLRWCEEDFSDREEGSDFIVFVSRMPSFVKSNWVWVVEVAEIEGVSPQVTQRSFARACKDFIPLQTVVALKNRRPWFQIPMGTQPNLQEIFFRSYEEVFPGQSNEVVSTAPKETLPQKVEEPDEIEVAPLLTNPIDELRSSLAAITVDDWEDHISD